MNAMNDEISKRIFSFNGIFGGTNPILNSPMPGVTTPEMVAAVCNAGGLGVIAGDFLTPEELSKEIAAVRELTCFPFAVNLRARDKEGKSQYFDGPEDREAARKVQTALGDLAQDLGLPEAYEPARLPDFEAQLDCIIREGVEFVCVSFGGLREVYADKLKEAGITVFGAATTLREVKVMRSAGVAAVIVQGAEAGGPRLNFEAPDDRSLVGLMSLIGPAARASGLPVIASGGIATGKQMAAAFVAGASGVMFGTAFLRSNESAAHPAYKEALAFTPDNGTVLTRVYDGRLARVIDNGLLEAIDDSGLKPASYPNQWKVMAPLAKAAAANDRDDLMPMYAGQGADLARAQPIQDIIDDMNCECNIELGVTTREAAECLRGKKIS